MSSTALLFSLNLHFMCLSQSQFAYPRQSAWKIRETTLQKKKFGFSVDIFNKILLTEEIFPKTKMYPQRLFSVLMIAPFHPNYSCLRPQTDYIPRFYTLLFSIHCNWHHADEHEFAWIQEVINISDREAHSLSPWQHVISDTERNWFQKQIKTPEL